MEEKCPLSGLPCQYLKQIHVTNVGPNNKLEDEFHFCNECIMKKTPLKDFINYLASAMHQQIEEKKVEEPAPNPVEFKACDQCGVTIKEIAEVLRLGCDHCYVSFANELDPVIQKLHGSNRHCGKRPVNIETLQSKLEKLIEEEKYEEARIVKTKIENFKK